MRCFFILNCEIYLNSAGFLADFLQRRLILGIFADENGRDEANERWRVLHGFADVAIAGWRMLHGGENGAIAGHLALGNV